MKKLPPCLRGGLGWGHAVWSIWIHPFHAGEAPIVAPPAGLEPTTNGLEGRCSIH